MGWDITKGARKRIQCLERSWALVTDDTDFDYVDGLTLEHW
ncbi:PIN domain-containing protein [Mastigocoleus testarum]|nr:hypothetical protein [Mastigocoleus testarum]